MVPPPHRRRPVFYVAPGNVVEGARPSREHGGRGIAVEDDAAEVQYVEHLHPGSGRQGGVEACGQGGVSRAGAGALAGVLNGLGDGVGVVAMAAAHRGVDEKDDRSSSSMVLLNVNWVA